MAECTTILLALRFWPPRPVFVKCYCFSKFVFKLNVLQNKLEPGQTILRSITSGRVYII